jgi:hypothetical protein
MPSDAIDWFRGIFAEANRRVTQRLVNVPNIRETSLDDGLIECLIPDTAPLLLPSGTIVRMDAHNVGGLRRIVWPPWKKAIHVGDDLVALGNLVQKRRDINLDEKRIEIGEKELSAMLEDQQRLIDTERNRLETLAEADVRVPTRGTVASR